MVSLCIDDAPNYDDIQLIVVGNTDPHHDWFNTIPNGLYNISFSMCNSRIPPYMHSSICSKKRLIFFQEATFLRWRAWHHCIRDALWLSVSKCLFIGLLARLPHGLYTRFCTVLVECEQSSKNELLVITFLSALSYRTDVLRGPPDLVRPLKSFVNW